ncbi:Clp protease ClpP [Bacteroidales bacterium OttesenSCG-928-C19]|nr:Clp protease ClpP [Bacteroidales bacterium OttesenSCG-928-C19]
MIIKYVDKTKAEVKLYGNIGNWFANGDVFTSLLDNLEEQGYTDVTFRMHCYGGSVIEGNVMGNALARTKLNVSIEIEGIAASMGLFLLPYVKGENVSIASNGFGMIHRPKDCTGGDADDHVSKAKLLRDIEANFVSTVSNRTGMSAQEVRAKWLNGKDHWLNADEMVQYGFASKKITSIADMTVLDKQIIEGMSEDAVYSHFEAKLNPKSYEKTNQNLLKMNKELLITAFGLTGVTAESSDADVLKALQAKFQTLEQKVTGMEAAANTQRDNTIKAMLDSAQSDGKIVPSAGKTVEQIRATLENVGKTSGVDALADVLATMVKPQSIADQLRNGDNGGSATAPKTFDELVALGDDAVAKFKSETPEEYNKLYTAAFGFAPRNK